MNRFAKILAIIRSLGALIDYIVKKTKSLKDDQFLEKIKNNPIYKFLKSILRILP